ncbi:hypothetical protein CFAM422_002051 [Trichoderma lentiforme]|uniref:Uncharacterized protein n=1 Tax=Trichoderma lentiforme TaxID=1567552 RepID=A0A9P5CHW6_9HYPO|nr:hypothetical protein CFAM422_002051 [Trichoderma lentiforme]
MLLTQQLADLWGVVFVESSAACIRLSGFGRSEVAAFWMRLGYSIAAHLVVSQIVQIGQLKIGLG